MGRAGCRTPFKSGRHIAQNQHYFVFLTITFSHILCWVGSNRPALCGDLIEPFRRRLRLRDGWGTLRTRESAECVASKKGRGGYRRPQVLVWGSPAEPIPAAEMACLSGVGGNLEILLHRLSEAVINKRPRQAGASGAASREDGP